MTSYPYWLVKPAFPPLAGSPGLHIQLALDGMDHSPFFPDLISICIIAGEIKPTYFEHKGSIPSQYLIPSAYWWVAVMMTYSFWNESLAFCGSTRYWMIALWSKSLYSRHGWFSTSIPTRKISYFSSHQQLMRLYSQHFRQYWNKPAQPRIRSSTGP